MGTAQDEDGRGPDVVRHPDSARLTEACELLHSELVSLLVEREHLVHLVRHSLEALYIANFGPLKHELLTLQVTNRRMVRRLELMRAALNRGALPDLEGVDRVLDAEFLEWEARLRVERAKVDTALEMLSQTVTPEEERALRSLFRTLALKLHPDVNPGQTTRAAQVWLAIQDAYRRGDLGRMKALALLAEGHGLPPPALDSLEALRARRRELQAQVGGVVARLAEIKAMWPFTMMESIEDETWVEERRAVIGAAIDVEKERRVDLMLALAGIESEATSGR
ncbi:MAG: J domain-containing protein [Armatimonadetes bacterium]|nr:J domain-containing protein [Armatimonadota bacterium]